MAPDTATAEDPIAQLIAQLDAIEELPAATEPGSPVFLPADERTAEVVDRLRHRPRGRLRSIS